MMRTGDTRPFHNDTGRLTWLPDIAQPFRWKPKHGDPYCVVEKISQRVFEHRLSIYIAIVVTAILVIQVTGVQIRVW